MKKHGSKLAFFVLLVIAGCSAIVMLLWNALLPDIFGLGHIGFWQAAGLLVLVHLLSGGMGARLAMSAMLGSGKNPMREKWMKMSLEERQEFVKKRENMMFGHRAFPGGRFGFDANDDKKDDN